MDIITILSSYQDVKIKKEEGSRKELQANVWGVATPMRTGADCSQLWPSKGSLWQNINYLFIENICFVNSVLLVNSTIDGVHFLEFRNTSSGLYLSMEWIQGQSLRDNLFNPWNGKEVPRWWLLRYRKWVPQQLGDEAVIQLPCYQTREWGQPTNGSMARRHCDTWTYYICCPGVVNRSLFAVQAWSNLWDLIWEPPSHRRIWVIF